MLAHDIHGYNVIFKNKRHTVSQKNTLEGITIIVKSTFYLYPKINFIFE